MDTTEKLRRALEDHSALRVVYHAGSQAGTERTITPLALEGEFLRARCHATGKAKVYRLDKLELVDMPRSRPDYSATPPAPPFSNLSEVRDHFLDTFEGLGWHVEFQPGEDGAWLTLHRCRKNGTPLKGWDVGLWFERFRDDSYFDGEAFVTSSNPVERTRPFVVRRKDAETRTFGSIDKVVENFMTAARELSPVNSGADVPAKG